MIKDKPWFKSWPENVKKTIIYPEMTLIEHFEKLAIKKPDICFLTFLGIKYTFREIKDQIDRFAAALYSLGVRKGDHVS
ncbi:MAG: AMP-binding protein, partial [Candidatus Hodarchaeota archaeon]